MPTTEKKGVVSIVLVNWNGQPYLEDCLSSVLSQSYTGIELFIIDNASTDGSPDWLERTYPQIKVHRQSKNLGFARAHNLGISLSESEYYMPLNFDLVLEPDFVECLVGLAEARREAGSFTGRLLQLDEHGGRTNYIDTTGHIIRKSRTAGNRGYGEVDRGQYSDVDEVFGVSATAPLYRRTMLESIRIDDVYYDESYFAYWEDVDLDWRAQHAGWKALYCPHALGYHYRGGGRDPKDIAVRLTYRNRYLTILKNDSPLHFIKDLLHILPYEAHRLLQMTIDPNFRHLWSMVPPTLRQVGQALKKRRTILRRRRTYRVRASPSRLFLPLTWADLPSFRPPKKTAQD